MILDDPVRLEAVIATVQSPPEPCLQLSTELAATAVRALATSKSTSCTPVLSKAFAMVSVSVNLNSGCSVHAAVVAISLSQSIYLILPWNTKRNNTSLSGSCSHQTPTSWMLNALVSRLSQLTWALQLRRLYLLSQF